jgi:hypothetical protein
MTREFYFIISIVIQGSLSSTLYILMFFRSEDPLVIGDENLFQTQSSCFARTVGSKNVFFSRSTLAYNSSIGDGCVVAASVTTAPGDVVANNTTVQPYPIGSHQLPTSASSVRQLTAMSRLNF